MIYTRTGTGISIDGTFFPVGMYVRVNDTSDYAGLYGVITEIRTDEDRETENDTPDIYCRFNIPVLPVEVKHLEDRFSALYGKPMSLEDISLDMVIMAPEMLTPSFNPHTSHHTTSVWAVAEEWAADNHSGYSETLYVNREDARAAFHYHLSLEATAGLIHQFDGLDDFAIESSENMYECWLDNDYIGNHYRLALEEKPLLEEPSAKGALK